jgi:hypothetical protein
MFKYVKNLFLYAYVMFFYTLLPSAAFADEFTIDTKTGIDLGNKIKELVTTVGMPVGGAILFLAVAFIAVQLMLSSMHGQSQKRAEVMGGLGYVAIGGILLGGALFFAGVILGAGSGVFK